MSENAGYEGHWPPRPVWSVEEGQTFRFPDPRTGCVLTGTVVTTPRVAALMRLENGEYTWAWVHELSEVENAEPLLDEEAT